MRARLLPVIGMILVYSLFDVSLALAEPAAIDPTGIGKKNVACKPENHEPCTYDCPSNSSGCTLTLVVNTNPPAAPIPIEVAAGQSFTITSSPHNLAHSMTVP